MDRGKISLKANLPKPGDPLRLQMKLNLRLPNALRLRKNRQAPLYLRKRCLAPLIVFCMSFSCWAKAPKIFSFHLKYEPVEIASQQLTTGESTYLFGNLYRGLIKYDDDHGLVFDLAQRCQVKTSKEIHCTLKKNIKWSDGSPITAQDFVDSFLQLVSPGSRCPCLPLLNTIKNAKSIFLGKAKPSEFGMKALSKDEIEFNLDEPDGEFLDKLSNPLLVPYRALKNSENRAQLLTNGPYKIKQWIKGQKIILEPNYYYPGHNPRPEIEIYFAAEDMTALNLYEKGKLGFLWRLPTSQIPVYKGRPDFFQKEVARFDYLGFNIRPGSTFEKKEVRKAFARALDFNDFKKVFLAVDATSWCPGIGDNFLPPEGHCVEFVANQMAVNVSRPVTLYFSQLGGDDIKKMAEWFQSQWSKNIKAKVELRSMEQKTYLTMLAHNPPDIFRKGVALNRPTCLAAFEIFSKDHAENYVGFNNLRFENLVHALATQKMNRSQRESTCGVAADILFKEEFVAVPLGRIHFSMLMNPSFKGWRLNELNQLDLADLEIVEK